MLGAPAFVPLPVGLGHPQHFIDRCLPVGNLFQATINQPLQTVGFKPHQVAPECPLAHPQQQRRFPLRQSTRLPASIRFFKSHLPYLL
jgi:hypothetical protein